MDIKRAATSKRRNTNTKFYIIYDRFENIYFPETTKQSIYDHRSICKQLIFLLISRTILRDFSLLFNSISYMFHANVQPNIDIWCWHRPFLSLSTGGSPWILLWIRCWLFFDNLNGWFRSKEKSSTHQIPYMLSLSIMCVYVCLCTAMVEMIGIRTNIDLE